MKDPQFLSQLKWNRSKNGSVKSKCGRYRIRRLNYSGYKAYCGRKVISSWYATQQGAKEACQNHYEKKEAFVHLRRDDDYTHCGCFHDNNQDRGVSDIQVTSNPLEVTCIPCLSKTHPELVELEKKRRMVAEIMKS
jgi:hypothetical protein